MCAATVGLKACHGENLGKQRAKARAVGVPFTGRGPDLQPGEAEATSLSRFEERSEELDAHNNTARIRRSASSSARDAAAEGWLAGRGIAPFAWNGRGWWCRQVSACGEVRPRMITACLIHA